MKKILIALCGIFLINCAHADMSALKVFVGGDFSLTGVQWDSDAKDYMKDQGVELPIIHNGLGAVLGLRNATRNVYNIGASLSYDYLLSSKSKIDSDVINHDLDNDVYYKYTKFSMGFSAFSATLDLYVRLFKLDYTYNKRGDLVLGFGPARIMERGEADSDILGIGVNSVKSDDYDSGFVVKLGYNGQIDQNWDWFLHGRWFALTGGDNDIHSLFNIGIGVRYNF